MVAIKSLRRTLELFVILYAVKCVILQKHNEPSNVKCYPSHFDTNSVYSSLSKVIYYFWENRDAIDITVYVGLYLTRIHLRYAFAHCDSLLYNNTHVDLFGLITNVTMSLDFFASKYLYENSPTKEFVSILTLFIEDGTWYEDNMELKIHSKTTLIINNNTDFEKYIQLIYDFERIEPSWPQFSKCLAHLAGTKYQFPTGSKGCPLRWFCHTNYAPNPMGTNGIGFSLTNKVGFLLMTKYSRPCHVTPFRENLINVFCDRMYEEAIVNYKNKLPLINLLAEQMAVCSLSGIGDLLFKEWLIILMKYQGPSGCLNGNDYSSQYHNNKLKKFDFSKFNPYGSLPNYKWEPCNRHLTTTYMVAMAAALRYIHQSPDGLQGEKCKFFFEKIYNNN